MNKYRQQQHEFEFRWRRTVEYEGRRTKMTKEKEKRERNNDNSDTNRDSTSFYLHEQPQSHESKGKRSGGRISNHARHRTARPVFLLINFSIVSLDFPTINIIPMHITTGADSRVKSSSGIKFWSKESLQAAIKPGVETRDSPLSERVTATRSLV